MSTDFSLKRLGDLTTLISSGSTPLGGAINYLSNGPILFLRSQNIHSGFLKLNDVVYIENDIYEKMSRTKVLFGDVLFNITGASIGRAATFDLNNSLANVNQHVCIIRPKDSLLSARYLMYILNSPLYQKEIDKLQHGGTRQGLTFSQIADFRIPFCKLSEQQRIATILDKADAIRRKRQEAIKLTDELLKSVFLDMFGDPVTNPKGWEIFELGEVCEEIYRYPTFYGFDYKPNGIPVARIGNILLNGVLDPDLSHYVYIDQDISKNFPRTILELNDIVMAVRGDGSTAKRIGLVESESLVGANISPNLLRFKANSKYLNPLYLFYFMISDGGQNLFEKNVTRTAKKTITSKDIKKIQIPIPTLSLQNEFDKIFRKNQQLKAHLTNSYQESVHLFNALIQRAFQGEL